MKLHPPLAWIEAGLEPGSAQARHEPGDKQPSPMGGPALQDTGWRPEQLQLLLAQARRAPVSMRHGLALAPGQIRLLALPQPPRRPVYLLISKVGPLLVHGWPVVSETDYASDTDWVLQEDDTERPLALSVAVVQLWNPLQLPRAMVGDSVNELRPPAWHALRAIEGPLLAPQRPPISQPDVPVTVTQWANVEFVTGAPLSPGARAVEERLAYRALYERWAEQVAMGALAALGRGAVPPVAAVRWKTLALASLVALATAVVWPLLPPGPQAPDEVYRSVQPSGAPAALLRVHLAPQATVRELDGWLTRWPGQIVAGPDDSGAYTLAVPRERVAGILDELAGSPLVDKAEAVAQP